MCVRVRYWSIIPPIQFTLSKSQNSVQNSLDQEIPFSMPFPKVYGSYTSPPDVSTCALGRVRITPSEDCCNKILQAYSSPPPPDLTEKQSKNFKKQVHKTVVNTANSEIKRYTKNYDCVHVEVTLSDILLQSTSGDIAAAFLDAGAEAVVVSKEGAELSRVDKRRIVVNWGEGGGGGYQ